jgi:3',5'-cyclic AMP phosphodiesterase CpdA
MWDLWRRVWREECSLPREHVIGNHDIWGWDKQRSQTTGSESRWGKQWALEVFGLSKPYRSFDRNGWHFVILDPCQPSATQTYTAFLDDEQFAWLAKDLAATDKNTPIVVISHIPILTVTTLLTARPNQEERPTDWTVPGHLMLRDARRVHELFRQHPNVKLALSGHIHQVDRVDYEGVTYICGGAICGAWWGGNYRGMEEGYGLIDLYRGGEFAYQYVPYGWKR